MQSIIETLKNFRGAQYASFTYTTKEKKNAKGQVVDGGERARYNVILGAHYINLLEKSILALDLMPDSELAQAGVAIDLIPLARTNVRQSLEKSLNYQKAGLQNPDYTKKDNYIHLFAGLSVNTVDNSLQLFGLLQSKKVEIPGVHRHVNSAPLTIAQNKIRKLLPISKFREFALDVGNIHEARLSGDTLVLS